jgi:predicted Zn-dependent protease with MMP-like domain
MFVSLVAVALSHRRGFVHIGGMEAGPESLTAPDIEMIERLAHAALGEVPQQFRSGASQVLIRVVDMADDAMLDDLGIEDPFTLTGLYDGVPLTEKSVMDQPNAPDVIWLFRRAILDEWCARGDIGLDDLVAHIFVHELAHHFGWTDEQIARIDRWWE